MTCENTQIFSDNSIHPEKPLQLVKFSGIHDDGSVTNILKLYGEQQDIKFSSALYLADNSITFVIPKYIIGKCGEKYMVSLPDIIVNTITDIAIDIKIIESSNNCEYYIMIPVSKEMFVDCDLVLRFVKLDIVLELLTISDNCGCKKTKCKHEWKWIASVIL